ncbi:arsenite efflux transporter metallochaperone ArsD [Vagococcus teuberi]|uniref:Transcriptional regulator n=1 Tax=Vagococcus teuberi TaxID=519472 RepID=A0A1J0A683_9ENTE|nr:transcriptional regulator [Vagococcus teuberi]
MKLELFEEALCCSTGVCGPSVDENLLRITGVFESLNKINQVTASRYNLSSNPADFTKNETVLKELQEKGNNILPITLVNDKIVKTGSYPTNEEIQEFTGITFVTQNSQNSSCCEGNGTC